MTEFPPLRPVADTPRPRSARFDVALLDRLDTLVVGRRRELEIGRAHV